MAMLSACKLLNGGARKLAALSLLTCTIMMICVGWSMLYALALFVLLIYKIKPSEQSKPLSI
ncbi:hypothetical protein JCM19238_180 [Vibrio ponticus]|nr:hypothetical protein JCM19238_180 [Vibrio ponticus]